MLMRVSTLLLAPACLAAAQSPSNSGTQHTLATFAFVRTGERTPILRNDTQILTALGAQQMYALGENFRTRYIAGDSPRKLGVERVAGLSVDIIDNDQIWVQTLDKPYLVSSAQAFMQGLYPPHISNQTGKAAGPLADGSHVDYPLNGYQYASIQAAGEEDPNSRYVSGSQNCPMAQVAALEYFTTEEFKKTESANVDLFKKLKLAWLEGNLPEAYFNARSALEIADYMSYQYMHNSSIHEALSANDSDYIGVYDRLAHLADEVAWNLFADASDESTDSNNQVMGGKTLAGSILNSFRLQVAGRNSSVDNKNASHPLTFYFGEEDAMMGLASLLKLDSNSPSFKSIPSYGSAMIFELFSTGEDAANPADFWVRFSFHNATDASADQQPIAYPLSHTSPTKLEMHWTEFESLFSNFAMQSTAEWCTTCNSASLFCRGASSGSSNPDLNDASSLQRFPHRISPVVGGIIGAFVTLIVAALCFALVMLATGLRFHRIQRPAQTTRASLGGSGGGGFKGAAKLASDTDVSVSGYPAGVKHGHERIGSWELGNKEFGARRSSESESVEEQRVRPDERV